MEEDFIKETKVIDRDKIDSYKELMNNIEKVRKTLEADYNNLQLIKDVSLVDYYTYKIKSEEAKFDFLIKEAKKMENGTYK